MAWQWNAGAKRYQDAESKRFISASSAVDLRDHYLDMQRQAMADLAKRVSAGEISIGQWEREMRIASRETFTASFAYGRGGRQAMTSADRVQLGELITGQHTYLNGFARDLQVGAMSPAQVEARAQLYANAGVLAAESGQAAAWSGSDYEERNVLGASDSCSQCPDLTALGWVEGNTLPKPGLRSCKANCRCALSRRLKISAAAESQRLRVVA